jgi:OOP family OmpA-OmpF porin
VKATGFHLYKPDTSLFDISAGDNKMKGSVKADFLPANSKRSSVTNQHPPNERNFYVQTHFGNYSYDLMHLRAATGDPQDKPGSRDPALFSRMPGFFISTYEELDFDRHEFPTAPDMIEAVEGRHYFLDYYAKDSVKIPSRLLQITRNYANAAKTVGGKIMYEYEDGGTRYVILKVAKDDAEAWAQVEAADNGMYKVHIIEKQRMKQEVTANADMLAGSISETGKAAVYGIHFDTGKSEIRPESEPAISEIVKMLKTDASLNLYVVGHTDNVGPLDYNLKLSQARAAAVINALVNKNGIAAQRLTPFGAGPAAPVASNDSEQGRAKNRRVELVKQ